MAIFILIVQGAHLVSAKLKIPQVLGEIVAGIIIGPSILNMISLTDSTKNTFFETIKIVPVTHEEIVSATLAISFLAEIAALFLLFEVGLEVNFALLRKVGRESLSTAIGGIVVPFAAGGTFVYIFQNYINPGEFNIWLIGLFLGATLTATSIGISIRVLIELGRIDTNNTRILIGAAIIDDIIALLLFSIVLGYAEEEQATGNGSGATAETIKILFGIFAFFIVIILTNKYFQKYQANKLKNHADKYRILSITLAILFFLSWLAGVLYLAPIVGAFMGGIIVGSDEELSETAQTQITPIARWLVPFFFLAVGLRIDLSVINNLTIIILAIILAIFAILSKIVGSGLGAYYHDRNISNALEIGVGMSPRGEVILIIATSALGVGVFDESIYAMIVMTVLISAILAPIALRYIISRREMKSVELEDLLKA